MSTSSQALSIVPVLLAGGSGTRLWPMSREGYPKQFLNLDGEGSLLENTVRRAARLPGASAPMVICGEEHRFIVAEQLRRVGATGPRILLEPAGRNTAPAAALAAIDIRNRLGDDALMMLMPADHVIRDSDAFAAAVNVAVAAAGDGLLVTFGIVADQPETGYGYIRAGDAIDGGGFRLNAFVEKPDIETAQRYVDSGDYYWNGGMFVFQAGRYLDELGQHAPEILAACEAACETEAADLDFIRPLADAFLQSPDDSIDYAVMEKTSNAAVVPLDAGWNDVGSWMFMDDLNPSDAAGNVLQGDVVVEDVENSLIRSESRLVAAIGLRDHIVVETRDAVLVTPRGHVQDVKKIVNQLRAAGRSEVSLHPQVYRPWGSYETIVEGERFQVKRIIVKPGQKLSLQMHHHRAEHWIVVQGTARVTCGETVSLLSEDESTYIPLGTKHRLENPGTIELELIEVQSGAYLGEDDIVRFEDDYGRSGA